MELVIPVGHHWLVVVGPAVAVLSSRLFAVGTQNLDVMYTDNRRQATVMSVGVAECLAGVVNFLGIQQSAEDGLVGLEDGAVLM